MNNNIINKAKDSSVMSWTIHVYTPEPKVDGEGFQLGDKWTIYK
jgi:hypothetical protein